MSCPFEVSREREFRYRPNNEVHRAIHERLKSLNQYPDFLYMYTLCHWQTKQLVPDELLSQACCQDRQNIVQVLMDSEGKQYAPDELLNQAFGNANRTSWSFLWRAVLT